MDSTGRELPRYKCHKEVWALKIADIYSPPKNESDGSFMLKFKEEGYADRRVSHEWLKKHEPKLGGYFVVYEDGYQSYSPAAAFEEGYTRI